MSQSATSEQDVMRVQKITTPTLLSRRCAIALVLAAVSTPGCAPERSLQFEVCFDITPKDIEERINRAAPMANFVKRGDKFRLWATDNQTTIITTERPASEKDAQTQLASISEKVIPSTDLARCFEKLADIAEKADTPLILIIYTDGTDDSKNPAEVATRINAAATRLAKVGLMRALIIAGTVRDTRPGWTGLADMLAPIDSKLSVLPMATLDPNQVHRIVRDARAKAGR